jgi:small conductance mechanosensitive channel
VGRVKRPPRRLRRGGPRHYRSAAEGRLRRFRQGSILAVAITAVILILLGEPVPAEGASGDLITQTVPEPDPGEDLTTARDTAPDPGEAAREATETLQHLARSLYAALPVIGIVLLLLIAAGFLAKAVGFILKTVLASWERAQATAALASVFIWLVAIGAALSVVAGDARALVGSVGLFGLALSWAMQAPIESFTGWLLNSFRGYYRIGDRIAVGEVFGDVARIDFLTTTVYEAGGPDKPVQAAQSTGATVTFPNLEVLRSNIVNFTRDFPYVWDELTIAVSNESDLAFAANVLQETADTVLGDRMRTAAEDYAVLLERTGLAWDVSTRPEVYASVQTSWVDLTIRYVVPAREMRRWSSALLFALHEALGAPDTAKRVFSAYPRSQVQPVPPPPWADSGDTTAARADG